jgi:hypothetical protein
MSESLKKYLVDQRRLMLPVEDGVTLRVDPTDTFVYSATDVDALLRQREEELQQQCRQVGYESVALLADAFCEVMNQRTDLRDQLAAMTAERDEALKKARWKHTHDDSLELELEKQLTTAVARITQLEGWLQFIKRDDSDAGTWESADESCVDFYRNCDMALEGKPIPTERPPA